MGRKFRKRTNIYWPKCSQCGNKQREYYLKENGPHFGLYCKHCDKWHKWVKRDSLLELLGYKNINEIYDKDGNLTSAYKVLNLTEPPSLSQLADVDVLAQCEIEKLDLPF